MQGVGLAPSVKSQQRALQRGIPWLVRASRGDSREQAALLHGRGDLLYERITHINRESLKKNWTKSSFFLYTCYLASPATCSHNNSATLRTSVVWAAVPQLLPSYHGVPRHTGSLPVHARPGTWVMPAPWPFSLQCFFFFFLTYALNLINPVLSPRDKWVMQ